MITNYFVLAALSREWDTLLRGAKFVDSYSHLSNEVTLVFETSTDGFHAVRVSTRPGNSFVYSQHDPRRPKSNVTTLFEIAVGRTVEHVAIAKGDRVISVVFNDGSRFEIHPYGSRANVYLVGEADSTSKVDESDLDDEAGQRKIVESFKRSEVLVGQPPPPARQARSPLRLDDPRFAARLVKEAEHRSRNDPSNALKIVSSELAKPSPVVYEIEDTLLFSPIELSHLGEAHVESFKTVDEGVRWTVKNRSRRNRFRDATQQLSLALDKSASRWARRVGELERAIESESRADRYETWGHLLMANPTAAAVGADEAELADILGDGSIVKIPLETRKTVIQNAERYYDRARKSREERQHLGDRLAEARANHVLVTQLVIELGETRVVKDVERFRKIRAEELRRFVGGKTETIASAPFRRFKIVGGFEVWVGRNAKENDLLTFEHAARHDLWMHARGTPGSHVVLRVPGRTQRIEQRTKEIAAGIAAWFSGARGSGLVPVQIAQKKHVTKPRGAAPGVVRVQNEEVVLVHPGLPSRI